MFWSKIRKKLSEYGNVTEWSNDYMVIPEHDNICGLGLIEQGKDISIISHKSSYGGNDDLFEIMPSINEEDEYGVDGFLTEEQALQYIDILMNK